MKSAILAILSCLPPAALIALDAVPQVSLSVSLSASPAGQITLGSQVTLQATATIHPKDLPTLGLLQQYISYTFSARRTSPSPATVAIATNVATKTVAWTPQSVGVYEISVRATYIAPSKLPPPQDSRLAPSATASLSDYKVVAVPVGPDLIPIVGPWMGECSKQPCSDCPDATVSIYVRNSGNATDAKLITIIVKYQDQLIQTWTTIAPAAGTQVKVGSYTTFPWNCPPIESKDMPPNYFVTVDATNAVAETNEQNNVHGFYLRFPERTTFQSN